MKAIEKDRTRRYETANGLALDIQRYLANEPVTAVAPSFAYLFRKLARRHRAALSVAALIAVVLVAATGISLWQAKRAITAKKETADALGEVEKQKAEVEKKNTEYRAILAEADRSDRAIADGMLRAGLEREAFAHLARACEYQPLSIFAAQKAVAALNTLQQPLPTTILTGHEDAVLSAQFSPDGSRIVTASGDNTARLWDAATWQCLATFAGHAIGVRSAQFSPDGSRILTASWDETVCLWTILPTTAGPPPAWFADFLRYLAQMRLNSDGEPEPIKTVDWLALRERLREVRRAGAGQDTPYLNILRRYVPE
jgi:hypothetical protein